MAPILGPLLTQNKPGNQGEACQKQWCLEAGLFSECALALAASRHLLRRALDLEVNKDGLGLPPGASCLDEKTHLTPEGTKCPGWEEREGKIPHRTHLLLALPLTLTLTSWASLSSPEACGFPALAQVGSSATVTPAPPPLPPTSTCPSGSSPASTPPGPVALQGSVFLSLQESQLCPAWMPYYLSVK